MVCENSHYIKAKHIIKKKMHTKSLFRLKDFTISKEIHKVQVIEYNIW